MNLNSLNLNLPLLSFDYLDPFIWKQNILIIFINFKLLDYLPNLKFEQERYQQKYKVYDSYF